MKRLIATIDEIAAVILRVTRYVVASAPLASFAALAATVMSQGLNVLLVYAKYIGKIRSPLLLAFCASSSEAAYPQTSEPLGPSV